MYKCFYYIELFIYHRYIDYIDERHFKIINFINRIDDKYFRILYKKIVILFMREIEIY
jgi:hypothetical protein